MIRCKLKNKVGFHIRKEAGKGTVTYKPGDIMKVTDISELGGAKDKFEILDLIPEENELDLDAPVAALKMEHRGGGRYNIVNVETDEPVNEEYLTKKEATAMLDAVEPEAKDEDGKEIDVKAKRARKDADNA